MENFETELKALLNKYSKENASITPDYLLAEYLCACLSAWDETMVKRDILIKRGQWTTGEGKIKPKKEG